MFQATLESIPSYLTEKSLVTADEKITVTKLKSGDLGTLFNVVSSDKRWIFKQISSKLDGDKKISAAELLKREADCLVYLSDILHSRSAPQLVHSDPDNHICLMTGIPENTLSWDHNLVHRQVDADIAADVGSLLGSIHRLSYGDEKASQQLGDKRLFSECRLDPIYIPITEKYPRFADQIGSHATALVTSSICFVHGNYIPENVLITQGRLLITDFEMGHFGHPSFDVCTMLAHLTLKIIQSWASKEDYLPLLGSFWNAYVRAASFESESWHERSFLPHLGCALLGFLEDQTSSAKVTAKNDRARLLALASSLITREIPSMRVYLDIMSRAL